MYFLLDAHFSLQLHRTGSGSLLYFKCFVVFVFKCAESEDRERQSGGLGNFHFLKTLFLFCFVLFYQTRGR